MKPEKLVEACTTQLEMKALIWKVVEEDTSQTLEIVYEYALNNLPAPICRVLAQRMKEMASGLEG